MKIPYPTPSNLLLIVGLMLSPLASAQAVSVATNTGSVPVPLGPADVEFISKTVSITGPRTLVIHYFAECQVPRGHVEYDIVANKGIVALTAKQISPTHDNLSALCSNDSVNESTLKAATVGTVVACTVTSAANYTVRVRGHIEGIDAVGPGGVDDQSLVIEEHPFSNGVDACVNALPGDLQSAR